MNNIVFFIVINLTIVNLNNDSFNISCWYNSKKLLTSYNNDSLSKMIIDVYRITDGNSLVFEKNQKYKIGSEFFSQTILFQIDSNLDSFEYVDQEIINTSFLVYYLGGAGLDFPDSVNFHISDGILKGNKIDSLSWEILVDVCLENKKVKFKEMFYRCND